MPIDVPRYLASLPERSLRAGAALLGGAVYETTRLALPTALRDSRLYQATVDRLLRILIELVGGVPGRYPVEAMPAGELALRKAAGNVMEVAGLVTVGWSPLWLLAAVADVVGGSQAYLRALEAELKEERVLPADATVASFDDLLSRLGTSSGVLADAIDIPPTSLAEARGALATLRAQADDLPSPDELGAIFAALQSAARKEGRSLAEVSAAVGLAAARAGIELGNVHVFAFYRDALRAIADEGLLAFLDRVARPYLARAGQHFRPGAPTYTDRLLDRLHNGRGGTPAAEGAPAGPAAPVPADAPNQGTGLPAT